MRQSKPSRYLLWILIAALSAVALLSSHRTHFLGYLPLLFILGCVLHHVFMHRGHSGHGHASGETDQSALEADQRPTQS